MSDYNVSKTYIARSDDSSITVELDKFISTSDAYNYFNVVLNDQDNHFKEIKSYNLNKEENDNYAYMKALLNDNYYFYICYKDNYIIRSSISSDEEKDIKIIDRVYADLNLIENDSSNNNHTMTIYIIIPVILIVLVTLLIVIFKKKKKCTSTSN
jgi:hypothetical protein